MEALLVRQISISIIKVSIIAKGNISRLSSFSHYFRSFAASSAADKPVDLSLLSVENQRVTELATSSNRDPKLAA